jgi:CheY-like chemotaxis protein
MVGDNVDRLRSLTVLIVEDEWLVRMELTAAFEDEGWIVLESASAEDALAGLHEKGRVDLLVTDIRLSGQRTGWDLAVEARASDPGVAVIYVSANPPAPDRRVPGSVFIDKPALHTDVVAAARRLLG